MQVSGKKMNAFLGKTFSFIADVKNEVKKITWTTKKELKSSTRIVILTTVLFGFTIYLIDFLLKNALEVVSHILRLIFI